MATSQEQEIYQLLKAKIGQLDLQKLLRSQFFQLAEQTINPTDVALILYKSDVMSREDMEECIGESTTVYQNLENYRAAKNKNAGEQLVNALYETGNFHILRLLHQSSLLEQPDYTIINQPRFRFKDVSKERPSKKGNTAAEQAAGLSASPKGSEQTKCESYQMLKAKIRQVKMKELLASHHIFELLEHTVNPVELALIFFKNNVMSMQEMKECMNQSMILYQNLEVYRAVRTKDAGVPLIDALEQTGNFHILHLLQPNLMAHTKERATNVSDSTESQQADSQEKSIPQGSKAKTPQPGPFDSKTWAKEAVDSTVKSYIQKMADLFEDPDDFYDAKNLETIHEGLKADALTTISSIYKQKHQDDPSSHLAHLEVQLLEAITNQFKTVQEINRLRDSYFNAKARNTLDEAYKLYVRKMTDSFNIHAYLYKEKYTELSAREVDAYQEAVNYLNQNIPGNLASNLQVVQSLNEELRKSIKFWYRAEKNMFYFEKYAHIVIFILVLMLIACYEVREARVAFIFFGILFMLYISLLVWLRPVYGPKKPKTETPVYPAMAFVYVHEEQAKENLSS